LDDEFALSANLLDSLSGSVNLRLPFFSRGLIFILLGKSCAQHPSRLNFIARELYGQRVA